MEWLDVMSFIRPEVLILIVFIWCLGLFLKKVPWFKAEWMIPLILLVVSIFISILYIVFVVGDGYTADVIISAVIQGVIIAALAVFGNETIKQYIVKRPVDKQGGMSDAEKRYINHRQNR